MTLEKVGKYLGRSSARYSLFLCFLIVRFLPRLWLYSFADFISLLAYYIAVRQRRIALESLEVAFKGQLGLRERTQIAKDCFRNMAKSAVELMYLLEAAEVAKEFAVIEGGGHLDSALCEGKGVILVSAHFGNFPLALICLRQAGYKVNIILRRMRDEKIEDFLESRRRKMGIRAIYSTPRQVCIGNSLNALRDNQLLFIQLDQNFGSGGVFVDFFGQKAATAAGPVVLALRTGSPIVPLFIVRQPDNTHKIIIEPRLIIEREGSQEETLQFNVQRMTSIIESYIKRYPGEWGWIHRRWKSRPAE